eukprot:m.1003616 g.1003616  ORF g.1003616 m.1003616 type:complete len:267 (+) comp24045_c1_seq4:1106-1906(+)
MASDFDEYFNSCELDYENWWQSSFVPPNSRVNGTRVPIREFEGNFPTLETNDMGLHRTYYMNLLSFLQMARIDTMTGHQYFFPSAGPVCASTALYLWDTGLNALLYTLLEPSAFVEVISLWLSFDVHEHYAWDYAFSGPIGPWYALNDIMAFRSLEMLIRFSEQKEFLSRLIQGTSVVEWLQEFATYWKQLSEDKLRPQSAHSTSGKHREYVRGISSSLTETCDLTGSWTGYWKLENHPQSVSRHSDYVTIQKRLFGRTLFRHFLD